MSSFWAPAAPGCLPDQPTQKILHVADHVVEVQQSRLHRPACARRPGAVESTRPPVRPTGGFPAVGAPRIVEGEVLEQQVAVTEDGRQDVVEIVRDPSREPTASIFCACRSCSSLWRSRRRSAARSSEHNERMIRGRRWCLSRGSRRRAYRCAALASSGSDVRTTIGTS